MTAIGARVPRSQHAALLLNPKPARGRRPVVRIDPNAWKSAAIASEETRRARRAAAVLRREAQRQARIAAHTDRATLRSAPF